MSGICSLLSQRYSEPPKPTSADVTSVACLDDQIEREADRPRELFETVVCRGMEAGIVGGDGSAVDASLILADCLGSLEPFF
jgi:hypothetical protein